MFRKQFDFAKKIAIEHPTLLTLAIPTFIIGYGVRNASTLTKAAYYIGCVIAGAASGTIDGKLSAKRNQILNTDTL